MLESQEVEKYLILLSNKCEDEKEVQGAFKKVININIITCTRHLFTYNEYNPETGRLRTRNITKAVWKKTNKHALGNENKQRDI